MRVELRAPHLHVEVDDSAEYPEGQSSSRRNSKPKGCIEGYIIRGWHHCHRHGPPFLHNKTIYYTHYTGLRNSWTEKGECTPAKRVWCSNQQADAAWQPRLQPRERLKKQESAYSGDPAKAPAMEARSLLHTFENSKRNSLLHDALRGSKDHQIELLTADSKDLSEMRDL